MQIKGAYVNDLTRERGTLRNCHILFGTDERAAKEYILKTITAFKLYDLKEIYPEIPLDLIFANELKIAHKYSSWSYDPLALLVEEAIKAGIKIHFWVDPFLGETCNCIETVLRQYPDFSLCNIKGKEAMLLDVGKSRVVEFVSKSLVLLAKKYRPDGIHLDYVRYPDDGNWYCYCKECREKFKNESGLEAPDPGKCAPEVKSRWFKFLDENVSRMVGRISQDLRREYSSLLISAYVWGRGSDGEFYKPCGGSFQDWPQWISRNYLDFIIHTGYFYKPEEWGRGDEFVKLVKGRIPAYIAIGAYTPGGIKTKEEFLWHIYRAKESGADGVFLYHYPDCLRYLDI